MMCGVICWSDGFRQDGVGLHAVGVTGDVLYTSVVMLPFCPFVTPQTQEHKTGCYLIAGP